MPLGGLLNTLISLLEFLLPQSFMGLERQPIIYFVIFVLFLYLGYRFLKVAFKGILIFVTAALFPLVANYFLGMGIPVSLDSLFSYGVTGFFIYMLGIAVKSSVGILKAVTWPFRKLFEGSEEKEVEELKEKYKEGEEE